MVKFLGSLISHIYLIGLIVIICSWPVYPLFILEINSLPKWNEWVLLIWLSGQLVSDLANKISFEGYQIFKPIIITFSGFAILVQIFSIYFLEGMSFYDGLFIRNLLLAFVLICRFINILDFMLIEKFLGRWSIILHRLAHPLALYLCICAMFIIGFTLTRTNCFTYPYPTKNNSAILVSPDSSSITASQELEDVYFAFALGSAGKNENRPDTSRSPQWIDMIFTLYSGST